MRSSHGAARGNLFSAAGRRSRSTLKNKDMLFYGSGPDNFIMSGRQAGGGLSEFSKIYNELMEKKQRPMTAETGAKGKVGANNDDMK